MRESQIKESADFDHAKGEYNHELEPIFKGLADLFEARNDAADQLNEKESLCLAYELSLKNAYEQITELNEKLKNDENPMIDYDSLEALEIKIRRNNKLIQVSNDFIIPKAKAELKAAEKALLNAVRLKIIARREDVSSHLDSVLRDRIELDLVAWRYAVKDLYRKFNLTQERSIDLKLSYSPLILSHMKNAAQS